MLSLNRTFFSDRNHAICINGNGNDFRYLAIDTYSDLHFTGDTKCLPLYRYDKDGNRHDNLTDWGMAQFREQYADETISKEDIFHYVYAVLHCPAYRTKYEINLKRDFPRIPFYADFRQWASWGTALMELHIGYETVAPYALRTVDTPPEMTLSIGHQAKPKLKADKESGTIILDECTSLAGIPPEAWLYRLGNRSALEWVLDQYKEKKPSDPTIAEQFDTYRFADYKPQVIELLQRVCTVSVETMKIIREMNN